MSKYLAIAAVLSVIGALTAAYFTGRGDGRTSCLLENAVADQAQMDESREIKNAVEKLDDTGLRDAFDKLHKRPSH